MYIYLKENDEQFEKWWLELRRLITVCQTFCDSERLLQRKLLLLWISEAAKAQIQHISSKFYTNIFHPFMDGFLYLTH